MLKVESRESAHLRSRVKDLSAVPNIPSFNGLFAAITPLGDPNSEPILCRDTDSLIANFGDPRIAPKQYIDLYNIMQVVGNGGTCYVAKVSSGTGGIYNFGLAQRKTGDDIPDAIKNTNLVNDSGHVYNLFAPGDANLENNYVFNSFTITLSETDKADIITIVNSDKFACKFVPAENSIKSHYKITFDNDVTIPTADTGQELSIKASDIFDRTDLTSSMMEFKSALPDTLTFTAFITQAKPYSIKVVYLNINVYKDDSIIASAKVNLFDSNLTNTTLVDMLNAQLKPYVEVIASSDTNIAQTIFNTCAIGPDASDKYTILDILVVHVDPANKPSTKCDYKDYIAALEQYRDKKYVGCLMADLTMPVYTDNSTWSPVGRDDRRTIQYYIKDIARERKDTTCIFSTPDGLDVQSACYWSLSEGDYKDLWEYGQTNTTNYAEQSFYCELYYPWLTQSCTQVDSTGAKSVTVDTAPANLVINNILTSYRERGVQYPVAGDQGGQLPETCTVKTNPKTKHERDELVKSRINPIYDTGTRGVQIYGNETLNAGYTDLNAAHIARTLIYIRSTIDEYTERLKFSINSMFLWDRWKSYVSQQILEPLVASNALAEYTVAMGNDTTTPEEIANRTIKGNVSLRFYQSAEIFDLTYTVYSTSTTIAEAQANL
jgi:hypothetical protein